MGRLIERQAAIDLCDWYDNPSMHEDLEKLPSAQPEITWCEGCEYRSGNYCHHKHLYGLYVSDDFYCGYAVRRSDGQTN